MTTRSVCGLLMALSFGLASVHADDPVAAALKLTRESGSLPIWEKVDAAASVDLSSQVRSLSRSVFILGHPSAGYGTGFVISRKHRLIATNAHVADLRSKAEKMLAIGNDSSQVFEVDNLWYHPGVIRSSKAGIHVRSADPAVGDVFPSCPDVAVVHLAGDTEIPPEVTLAERGEIADMFARPVGMIGFPGHDTVSWPGAGESAKATYRQGVIARATDFYNKADVPTQDCQFLQHTMANWFGFSGSPIFLSNGHVAALNNSGSSVKKGGLVTSLAYGVRVDCLWELLAHHDLTEHVAVPVPKSELRLDRFQGEDPQLQKLTKARDLVLRARSLIKEKQWKPAGDVLDDATRLMPGYAWIYDTRATLYHDYIKATWGLRISDAIRKGQADSYLAYDDLIVAQREKALQFDPTNVDFLVSLANARSNRTFSNYYRKYDDAPNIPENRAIADKILSLPNITRSQKAMCYGLYGMSYSGIDASMPWYHKQVEATPYDPASYNNRGGLRYDNEEFELAAADRARAKRLEEAWAARVKAWEFATSNDASMRDGARAVQLAEQACQATDHQEATMLITLAAAHAEAGNFDEAVRWAAEAYRLADDFYKSEFAAHLRSYRNRKPWRG